MRLARALLIFAYGLFTIAAQTLLFREFVTAFEGNDISVGVFFGSWFLWVGLGAVLVRRWDRLAETLLRHIEFLFLLYIPAFAVQVLLIAQVRALAGVASYDLMSVQTIVLWAMVVNAPVSLVTGVLFPVACRWIERAHAFPVSRVYILEALGSFAGGLAVTVLLARHVHTVRVALLLVFVLLLAVGVVCLAGAFRGGQTGKHRETAFGALALAMLSVVAVATGADGALARRLQMLKWGRLLPRETLDGAFHTGQAEYLYGAYSGQWVVMREGSVCEVLPHEEEAGRTAALTLCQNPQATRVLVIGSGPALCRRFLALPQVEEVAWAHADGEYMQYLLDIMPEEFAIEGPRFHTVTAEIRRYLEDTRDYYDLVVLNLPDVTGSVFNRYYTLEFYERLKASLRAGGVVGVSIAGGEDVMGAELVGLGASARMTLGKVFSHLILVPGEQTWLLASDAARLTGDPAVLRDRFVAIEGSRGVYPAAGLLSVYLPDRAERALQAYEKAGLPPELLVNRDARPLTHLYGLLLAARQSGASVTRFVKLLAIAGWMPFLVPVLIFIVLRTHALTRQGPAARESAFDSSFLVFSTGWAGIAMVIILMYLYETHFGSLYLHVGVISSLFMAGLTAGAVLAGRVLAAANAAEKPRLASLMLIGVLLLQAVVLAMLALFVGSGDVPRVLGWSGHGLFAVVFILSGLSCGGYWPLAAVRLAGEALNPGEAGSRLETADHLGACLGGLVTSLLMVPVLGIKVSLLVLIGLVLANLPAAVVGVSRRSTIAAVPVASRWSGAFGYALLGTGACIVVGSNVLVRAGERLQPALPEYAVQALAGERPVSAASAPRAGGTGRMAYFVVADEQEKPLGYIFSSADLAPEVRGFGGRLNLAIHTDASGKLVNFLVARSYETPSYLELLRGWLDSLQGKALFGPEPFAGVDTVTGATVSSEAILAALRVSSRRFAEEVLSTDPSVWTTGGAGSAPMPSWRAWLPDTAGLYLVAAFVSALLVARRGGPRARLVMLAATLVAGGIVLNAQYSSEQVATLLSLNVPALKLTGVFLLAAGVPLLVLLFGNLYCGYICPFGAAQELLSHVLPRRFRPRPTRGELHAARFIKYIVLAVLVAMFFLSRDRRTLAGDPLTSVFALRAALSNWPVWMPGIIAVALLGSLFYVRFWCRCLCPVGAFLSLLSHVRLLRRPLPAKWFGRCEFGLATDDHLDCLYCDRCRHAAEPLATGPAPAVMGVSVRPLLLAAVIGGLLLAGVSVSRFREVMPLLMEEPVATAGAAGQPREVDVQRIRTLIEQGRLSDRKAEYSRPVD